MKVLLRQDVRDLGSIGDTVEVPDGYARNHLLPKQLAVEPNLANLKRIEKERFEREQREKEHLGSLKQTAARLSSASVTIKAKANELGHLFGSVTEKHIVDALAAEQIISRLLYVRPHIEGNLQIWEYLNGLKTVFVGAEKRERNVRLLDPNDVKKNAFHVTDEFSFSNGTHTNRAYVVFLINGVPVFRMRGPTRRRSSISTFKSPLTSRDQLAIADP